MAIRWDDLPHDQIRLGIYAKLRKNDVTRSERDARKHILLRRLSRLGIEDHQRFTELQARDALEHLRCFRDSYREFLSTQSCSPALEWHWVVLRFSVFPTAIMLLREQVSEYARLTGVRAVDLSLLFGIHTRPCLEAVEDGFAMIRLPDPDDKTTANKDEIETLSNLINDDTLLWFRDIQDGGAVGRPFGGGPFAIDDAIAIWRSFGLCGLRLGFTLPDWLKVREKFWQDCAPWTEGLCNLFGAVQEELIYQWGALPRDSLVQEQENIQRLTDAGEEAKGLKAVTVPPVPILPRGLERGRDCEELAQEIGTIRHKYVFSGMTVDEIENEHISFQIWKRVDRLSPEDQDTFRRPGTWEPGYNNLLLGKIYATARGPRSGGTINNWRKEYRAYRRWQEKNPYASPDKFMKELQQRKRKYRKSDPDS